MQYSPTTERILDLLLAWQRLSPGENGSDELTRAVHGRVIEAFVETGRPIHAILPAFPCKSPSTRKVLGRLPDEAERQALIFLDELFADIAVLHWPGAHLTLCSDGRVFAECLAVADDEITAYREVLETMARQAGLRHLSFFQLEDVPAYAALRDEPAALRRALDADHGVTQDEMRASLVAREDGRAMYAAVTRFMLEDRGVEGFASRTQAQKAARERALWTLCCSEAWGRLLQAQWPDALRLSIHPQPAGAARLGIRLLDSPDAWLTPWHATLLEMSDGTQRLVHREEADNGSTCVVSDGGRPVAFRQPTLDEVVRHAGTHEYPGLRPLEGSAAFGGMLTLTDGASPPCIHALLRLVHRHGLLVIRGMAAWADKAAFADWLAPLGQACVWPGGPVVEIAEGGADDDHVRAASGLPMHWDGMYLHHVPAWQAFACRRGAAGHGGRTVFAWTPGVLAFASPQQRQAWERAVGHYALTTADFHGRVRAPLVQRHPLHGYPVLRYLGPYDAHVANPSARRFTGTAGYTGDVPAEMDAALAEEPFIYAHDWQDGDVLLADNFALLHGREAFGSQAGRVLWRMQVQGPPTPGPPATTLSKSRSGAGLLTGHHPGFTGVTG